MTPPLLKVTVIYHVPQRHSTSAAVLTEVGWSPFSPVCLSVPIHWEMEPTSLLLLFS